MTYRKWLFAVYLLPLGLAAGCKDKLGLGGGGGGQSGSSGEEAADRALGEKLDPFIKCINDHSRTVLDSRRRYVQWIGGPGAGLSGAAATVPAPTCKGYPPYLGSLSAPDTCVQGVARVKTIKPSIAELEKGGDLFTSALTELQPLLRDAHRYYDQKDFKDDNCKKGQALHPKLMAAWNKFLEGDKIVREQVEKHNSALHERQLARTEKRFGRGLRYFYQKTMIDARKLLTALRTEDAKDKPDLEVMKKAVADYQTTADTLEQTADRNKTESDKVFWFSSFRSGAVEYLKAAKEYNRRRAENKRYDRSELMRLTGGSGWTVDGSFAKVLYKYNELVRASNNVKFDFGTTVRRRRR